MEAQSIATKTVSDLFSEDVLNGYVQSTVNMVMEGKPVVDGRRSIAAMHFYDTDHGRIGTLTTWVRGTPMSIYVGTEEEVKIIKTDFYKLVEESGFSFEKTPRERAELRRKERKKKKK